MDGRTNEAGPESAHAEETAPMKPGLTLLYVHAKYESEDDTYGRPTIDEVGADFSTGDPVADYHLRRWLEDADVGDVISFANDDGAGQLLVLPQRRRERRHDTLVDVVADDRAAIEAQVAASVAEVDPATDPRLAPERAAVAEARGTLERLVLEYREAMQAYTESIAGRLATLQFNEIPPPTRDALVRAQRCLDVAEGCLDKAVRWRRQDDFDRAVAAYIAHQFGA